MAAIRSATSSASALIGGGGPPRPAPPGGVALPGSVPGVRRFGGRSVSMYPSFEVSAVPRRACKALPSPALQTASSLREPPPSSAAQRAAQIRPAAGAGARPVSSAPRRTASWTPRFAARRRRNAAATPRAGRTRCGGASGRRRAADRDRRGRGHDRRAPGQRAARRRGRVLRGSHPAAEVDFTVGNLETTLGTSEPPPAAPSANCHAFQAQPTAAASLRAQALDAVNVANNHANEAVLVLTAVTRRRPRCARRTLPLRRPGRSRS